VPAAEATLKLILCSCVDRGEALRIVDLPRHLDLKGSSSSENAVDLMVRVLRGERESDLPVFALERV
jgi:hypothetical protein